MSMNESKHSVLWLFLASFLVFIWPNPFNEIIGFESRFYLFALNMWREGVSWFPTTYHQPYPDYPGTAIWVINGLANLFGHLNKWVAVLPNAIAAAITVVLTYLIGNISSKRWGWISSLFLMLTITFLKSARSLSLDVYPLLFTTWCFYLVYSADAKQSQKASWLIYPLMFLSFAFRGPIGVVMPAGVVCVYYLLNKNIRQLIISGCIAFAILVTSTLGLLALAQYVGGAAFKADVLRMQVLGRIDNPFLPVYFYFTGGILNNALSYPVACLTVFGMIYYRLRRVSLPYQGVLWQLLGWALVILVGMSIPDDKKIRYILPMLPAAALLAAYPFAVINGQKYFVYVRKLGLAFFFCLPTIFLLASLLLYVKQAAYLPELVVNYPFIFSALCWLQVLNVWMKYREKITTWIIPIATVSFVVFYINVIERIEIYIDRADALVSKIETFRAKNQASLVFYKERPDGLPIKYLVYKQQEDDPVFIGDIAELVAYPKRAVFVTSEEYFADLPKQLVSKFTILEDEALGHSRVVIFTQRLK